MLVLRVSLVGYFVDASGKMLRLHGARRSKYESRLSAALFCWSWKHCLETLVLGPSGPGACGSILTA